MNIIPSIDLQDGKVVRLYQGNYDRVTCYSNNPISVAQQFKAEGAQWIHIVDLDGAQHGMSLNRKFILDIQYETGLSIQTGGGIRNEKTMCALFDAGIKRVVLGTIAVTDSTQVKKWLEKWAQKIVLAFDVRMMNQLPYVAIQGWKKNTLFNLWDIVSDYESFGLKRVLCTDIDRDGTLNRPNVTLYDEFKKRFPKIQLQASGGVRSLDDVKELKTVLVDEVIVGRAIYEKKFGSLTC